jgi:hypothetical protein
MDTAGDQIMASPKSVKMGSAVAPAETVEVPEADTADPGEVSKIKAEQLQTKSGKYGKVTLPPVKAEPEQPGSSEEKKLSWIEIELVDEENKPVPGEPYKITTSDNKVESGTLDNKGFARVEGIEPGTCKVTFPKLDKDAWEKA